jgi:hypothetical protein
MNRNSRMFFAGQIASSVILVDPAADAGPELALVPVVLGQKYKRRFGEFGLVGFTVANHVDHMLGDFFAHRTRIGRSGESASRISNPLPSPIKGQGYAFNTLWIESDRRKWEWKTMAHGDSLTVEEGGSAKCLSATGAQKQCRS